jgi:hypothetical protein
MGPNRHAAGELRQLSLSSDSNDTAWDVKETGAGKEEAAARRQAGFKPCQRRSEPLPVGGIVKQGQRSGMSPA